MTYMTPEGCGQIQQCFSPIPSLAVAEPEKFVGLRRNIGWPKSIRKDSGINHRFETIRTGHRLLFAGMPTINPLCYGNTAL